MDAYSMDQSARRPWILGPRSCRPCSIEPRQCQAMAMGICSMAQGSNKKCLLVAHTKVMEMLSLYWKHSPRWWQLHIPRNRQEMVTCSMGQGVGKTWLFEAWNKGVASPAGYL